MTNEISYSRVGDYLLPNIILKPTPPEYKDKPLGRYARMHRAYLREHRPILYSQLVLTEKLFPLLWEIDESAQSRLDTIGNVDIAHEVILAELVYN